MKLIFLDIDGVLNTNYTEELTPTAAIFVEDSKIKILKQIIDETDAKVVLSSTWRWGWMHLEEGKESVLSEDFILLERKLREFNIELFDRTPYFGWGRDRGEEIKAYLDNRDDVEGYVIIDDMSSIRLRPCDSHLLQTSEWEGLQEEHVEVAKRIMEMEV